MKIIHHMILVGIFSFLLFLILVMNSRSLDRLPAVGDGPDYDMIAFQLSNGAGFSYDWDNPEYKAPYLARGHEYDYLQSRTGSMKTAYRPPLFPAIMALTFKIFGRTFIPIRLLNILFMSLTCVMGFSLVARQSHIVGGYLFALLLITYPQTFNNSAAILTESLACFLATLLAYLLIRFIEKRDTKSLVLIGIVMGLAILNRSIFIVWLPPMLIIIWMICRKDGWKSLLTRVGLMTILALVVISPWVIRNLLLLKEFMPFGTQSGIGMPGGYSDLTLENKGVWISPGAAGMYDSIQGEGLAYEVAVAKYGQGLGTTWIRTNVKKLPLLVFYKVVDLWRPHTDQGFYTLLFVFLGAVLYPWNNTKLVLIGILLLNTAAVAVTWSDGDRFLFPVLPIIYILFCVGFSIMVSKVALLKKLG